MARLQTPSDLTLSSVRSIPGLNAEDVGELRALGIVNLQQLMAAMDATSGRLHELSNDTATIEVDQAKRIGDALVEFELVPNGWRERWEVHNPPATTQTASEESATTTSQTSEPWYNRGFIGWLSGK